MDNGYIGPPPPPVDRMAERQTWRKTLPSHNFVTSTCLGNICEINYIFDWCVYVIQYFSTQWISFDCFFPLFTSNWNSVQTYESSLLLKDYCLMMRVETSKTNMPSKDENSIDHHVLHVGVGLDLMLVWCRHNILRWGD